MRGKPDQQRFEVLLREHQQIVFKVAGMYAHNSCDRDDLAQDITAQLWRSFGTFGKHRAEFSTWMYRVALNVAISYGRAARRRAECVEPLDEARLDTLASAGDSRQQAALEKNESIAALRTDMQMDRAARSMWRTTVLVWFEAASNGLCLLLLAAFIARHDALCFTAAGLILYPAVTANFASSVVQIVRLARLDYGGGVLAVQKGLESLYLLRLRTLRL